MSYSTRKLRLFVDDPAGELADNAAVVKRFCLAEDDNEWPELCGMLHPFVHFSSFWGVVRGPHAVSALLSHEQNRLRLTWLTGPTALSSYLFCRDGYVALLHDSALHRLPLVGRAFALMRQRKVRESLVVVNKRVVFRDLSYCWRP